MAKKKQETQPFSWSDFEADSDLLTEKVVSEDEEETEEEEDLEEEEEEEIKPKKKKAKEVVDEEEEEEDEEDLKPKKKKKSETEEEETEEESETEEEEEELSPEEEAKQFFDAVEKITGSNLEVEYGGVSPLSPQGVALREKAVREAALDDWLEEIETKFPAVFQALEYANNGGDVAELFSVTQTRDYSKVEIAEEDSELATEILKEYYQSRGVKSEAKIKRLIEADEESEGGLIKEANSALKELKAEQQDKQASILETQRARAEEQKKKDKIIVTAVDEVLESGKLDNFKLTSRQEKSEFKEFVLKNLRRTPEGKYEFATQITPGSMEQILKYQYFQFKKGDLEQLIEIKAASKNAAKLKLRAKGEQASTKKSKEQTERGSLSMKDFNV